MRRRCLGLAVALMTVHVALALSAASRQGPTFDEPAHLIAGCLAWTDADYRLVAEAGTIPLRWPALAVVASEPPAVDRASREFVTARAYQLGRASFFGPDGPGMSPFHRARSLQIVASILIGVVVFGWSVRAWGWTGGLTSLALWSFSPTVLGHAPLITTDALSALFLALGTLTLWRLSKRPTPTRVLLAGLACGGLFLTKLTWVLLPALACVFIVARGLRHGFSRPTLVKQALGLVGVALVAWGLAWGVHGFRFAAADPGPDGRPLQTLATFDQVVAGSGHAAPALRALHAHRLMPEAWLYGTAYTLQSLGGRLAFLDGAWSRTGWRTYFPRLFMLKEPLPAQALLLAALALGLISWSRQREARRLLDSWAFPALAMAGLHAAACIASSTNIGYRHFIPALPGLFIVAGAAGAWLARRRAGRWGLAALLGAQGLIAVAAWPHYLAWSNAAGGARSTWRHAVDSNCDWGQGLPELRRWLDARAAAGRTTEIEGLCWFGSVFPEQLGVTARLLPSRAEVRIRSLDIAPLRPGLYIFSASMLQRAYGLFDGPWTLEREADWQAARGRLPRLASDPAALDTPEGRDEADAFTELRVARLATWLRAREPLDVIGGSLVAFELSEDDLHSALDGPVVTE